VRALLPIAIAGVVGAAGCGSGGDAYSNEPRPPAPITVTGRIDERSIAISPKTFGAGPVTILVSNQTGATQDLVFQTDEVAGGADGIRRATGPIQPGSTGELKADPREGTYRLSVRDGAIRPAAVEVGPRRKSAQDELLQP
jgi:hypothetical protein